MNSSLHTFNSYPLSHLPKPSEVVFVFTIYFHLMWLSVCLHLYMLMRMCTVCVRGACEIQKMVSDALELEVHVAVSYHLSPLQEWQVLLATV